MLKFELFLHEYQIINFTYFIYIQNSCVEPRRDQFGEGKLIISNVFPDLSNDLTYLNINFNDFKGILPTIPFNICNHCNIIFLTKEHQNLFFYVD